MTHANASGQIMTAAAFHALIAAANYHSWGRFAAQRYVERHGSTLRLLTIALQLQAVAS